MNEKFLYHQKEELGRRNPEDVFSIFESDKFLNTTEEKLSQIDPGFENWFLEDSQA